MTLFLREATPNDSRFFYDLRTFEPYQKYFTSSSSIPFTNHERWFASRIDSSTSLLYVACSPSCEVGYVRFEPLLSFDGFEISFAIAPTELRKGYSAPMISQSLHLLRSNISSPDAVCVIANVFNDNMPSIATLCKCGFSKLYQNHNIILQDASASQLSRRDMHSYIVLL